MPFSCVCDFMFIWDFHLIFDGFWAIHSSAHVKERERERLKGIINNQTKGCSWFPWNLLGVLVIASPQRLLPPASLSTQSLVPDSHSEKDEDWLKKCSMKRIQCSFSSRMISLSLSRSCGCGFDSWSKPKDGNERWRRGRARTRKDSNNLCMVVAHVVVWVSWFRQKRIVFLLHRHGHHHRDVREKRVFCLVFYAFFLLTFLRFLILTLISLDYLLLLALLG